MATPRRLRRPSALSLRLAARVWAGRSRCILSTSKDLARPQCRFVVSGGLLGEWPQAETLPRSRYSAGKSTAEPPSRAPETRTEPSKLLEAPNGERLDFGTQGTASGTH